MNKTIRMAAAFAAAGMITLTGAACSGKAEPKPAAAAAESKAPAAEGGQANKEACESAKTIMADIGKVVEPAIESGDFATVSAGVGVAGGAMGELAKAADGDVKTTLTGVYDAVMKASEMETAEDLQTWAASLAPAGQALTAACAAVGVDGVGE